MKEAKPRSRNELLPGTLEMLILKSLSIEPMHGYGIAQHIQMLSADVLTVEEGSLYPALQRMRVKGWVQAQWTTSLNNRRARVYTLTEGMLDEGTGPMLALWQAFKEHNIRVPYPVRELRVRGGALPVETIVEGPT